MDAPTSIMERIKEMIEPITDVLGDPIVKTALSAAATASVIIASTVRIFRGKCENTTTQPSIAPRPSEPEHDAT